MIAGILIKKFAFSKTGLDLLPFLIKVSLIIIIIVFIDTLKLPSSVVLCNIIFQDSGTYPIMGFYKIVCLITKIIIVVKMYQ